jgi:hypothetical protein
MAKAIRTARAADTSFRRGIATLLLDSFFHEHVSPPDTERLVWGVHLPDRGTPPAPWHVRPLTADEWNAAEAVLRRILAEPAERLCDDPTAWKEAYPRFRHRRAEVSDVGLS